MYISPVFSCQVTNTYVHSNSVIKHQVIYEYNIISMHEYIVNPCYILCQVIQVAIQKGLKLLESVLL